MKIKKILGSLIIGFGLINLSSAGFLEIDLPGDGYQQWYGNHPYAYYVDKNFNFYTNSTYKFFQFTFDTSSNGTRSWLLFRNDNKLYSYGNYGSSRIYGQGYIKNGCISTVSEFNSKCLNSCYGAVGDCGARPNIFSNYQDSLSGFYNGSLGNFNKFLFTNLNGVNILSIACFIGDIYVVCVGNPITYGFNDYGQNEVGNLISSIGQYPYSFDNEINDGIFEDSPFVSSQNNTTVNQITCPTIQQLINNFESQYNTGLCYSNKLIYSGGQFQQVTPKTIFELYPQYQDFINDINTYYNYCKPPSTQETCGNAFTGKTEEWTLINKLPENVTPVNVYNYCNYTLNLDPNQTICTTSTGSLNPGGITVEDNIDNINRLPITVITPGTPPQEEGNGTGSVFDKYTQQDDETKRRDIIGKAENTIETMKEIYTKLSGIFRAREGKDGIIPPLITGLIALILLFKLWKK